MEAAAVVEKNIAEVKIIIEMIETEQTYNQSLNLLIMAFARKDIDQYPEILKLQDLLTHLRMISDMLLTNLRTAIKPETDLSERITLKAERTQILKLFFEAYKQYPAQYDAYLKQSSETLIKPYQEMDHFIKTHSPKQLGLTAHLMEPFQRGLRYKLLVGEALGKHNAKLEDRHIIELRELETLITETISLVNTSMAAAQPTAYEIGDITKKVARAVIQTMHDFFKPAPPAITSISGPIQEAKKDESPKP